MSQPPHEFALLLEAPHPVRAELARNLLAVEGIATILHGQDRVPAELGGFAHMWLTRPDVYVAGDALERAREILAAAFGPDVEWGEERDASIGDDAKRG